MTTVPSPVTRTWSARRSNPASRRNGAATHWSRRSDRRSELCRVSFGGKTKRDCAIRERTGGERMTAIIVIVAVVVVLAVLAFVVIPRMRQRQVERRQE